MTIAEWTREASRVLVSAGLSDADARQDAEVLGRSVLGWDRARWIVDSHRVLAAEAAAQLETLIARRARREPVAYILGRREFYGRDFLVTPAVLIPRPETELLVMAGQALARAAIDRGTANPHLLDVGTGSGCVAVTLALEVPDARVTATDVSPAALDVARDNASRLGAAERVTFVQAPFAAGLRASVDVLVSNPPYVALRDRDMLQPDVRDHEPALALFGGPAGFDVIDALVTAARAALVPGGALVMEIGAGQRDEVAARLEAAGFHDITFTEDLAGYPRIVTARVPAASV